MRPSMFLKLAAAVGCVCAIGACTTYAEINGPRIGVGIEIDHDLRVSPRFEVGWDYDRWSAALGWGGGVTLAWAPVVGRVEAVAEARVLAFPILGPAPISPLGFGFIGSWSRSDGWAIGARVGIGTLMYMPPEACVEGFFDGNTVPCPPGSNTLDTVIQRPWLPRLDYRVSILWSVDGHLAADGKSDKLTIVHGLTFGMNAALETLTP